MIRGSDGLDYENLTEKLLGNPANTYRNYDLRAMRAKGTPKADQSVWLEAYDREYSRIMSLTITQGDQRGYADHQACGKAFLALRAAQFAAQSRGSPG